MSGTQPIRPTAGSPRIGAEAPPVTAPPAGPPGPRPGGAASRAVRAGAMAAAALLALVAAGPALADCGLASIRVEGTPVEVADACRAVGEVSGYFVAMGLDPIREVTVRFEDRVVVDLFAPEGGMPVSEAAVSGVYVVADDEVRMTSPHRGVERDRAPWGVPWGPPVAFSILEHELAHAAIAENLGDDYAAMDPAWHEFIAYAVQFALMEAGLRAEILARNPGVEPFPSAESVNRVIHAADPDAFGLRAHLYAEANGGPTFLAALLTDRTTISTGRVDFLWTE